MAKQSFARKKTTAKSKSANSNSEVRSISLTFKQATTGLFLVSMVLLGVSGWFWWQSIFTNPDRILSDMLAQSLQTSSVTRHVTQQDEQSSLDQSVRFYLSPEPSAQTTTALSEKGPAGSSLVTTETIGTKNADFIRYRTIESPESGLNKDALGGVLNVWSKREAEGQPPKFLNEALLGIVPFGNLKKEDRQAVLKIMHDKNAYTYTKATQKKQDGRQVMVYEMSIVPGALVEALVVYAKRIGLGDLPELDPKAYSQAPPVEVQMTIDLISRELKSVKYAGSDRVEEYQSSGLRTPFPVPTQAIAFTELQKKLQNLQK